LHEQIPYSVLRQKKKRLCRQTKLNFIFETDQLKDFTVESPFGQC